MILYAETAPAVNSLRGYLQEFYLYLCSLYRMRGCFIRNQKLCLRFGKSHPTIQRWLSSLRKLGLIRYEQEPGRTRYIIPTYPMAPRNEEERRRLERDPHYGGTIDVAAPSPPPEPAAPAPLFLEEKRTPQGVQNRANPPKNEPPLTSKSDCLEKNSNGAAESQAIPKRDVVALLRQAGVPAPTALKLVEEKGEDVCVEQLEALPHRKADSPAAVLIAAIRGICGVPYAIPAALARRRDAANRAAAERVEREKAQKAAQGAKRAQESAESCYAALSPDERARLEKLLLPTLPPMIQNKYLDGRASGAMKHAILGWLKQNPS